MGWFDFIRFDFITFYSRYSFQLEHISHTAPSLPSLHTENTINTLQSSFIMEPKVTKAKSAFLYYQSTHLKTIKNTMGLSMGEAMTELSSRWKALSSSERDTYYKMEAEDRERFNRESMEADAEAYRLQVAKREPIDVHSCHVIFV